MALASYVDADFEVLKERVTALENVFLKMQTAFLKLATQEQIRELAVLKEETYLTIAGKVDDLLNRIEALENEVYS